MEATNQYAEREKKFFPEYSDKKTKNKNKQELSTGQRLTKTAKGVGIDVLAGVLGGGLAGAVFGPYSFWAGLAISAYGHYADNKLAQTLGLGVMASGTLIASEMERENPKASIEAKMEARVKLFGEELKNKLCLHKLNFETKPKTAPANPQTKSVNKEIVNKADTKPQSVGNTADATNEMEEENDLGEAAFLDFDEAREPVMQTPNKEGAEKNNSVVYTRKPIKETYSTHWMDVAAQLY